MENQQLFDILITLAGVLAGWMFNNLVKDVKTISDDLKDLPHVYLMKEDYKTDISDIKLMLNRIFELLDKKADK